jgi:hypothetical protein
VTRAKLITSFGSITTAGVDVSSSGFWKRNNSSPSYGSSTPNCKVFLLTVVNFQTACNDLNLESVQTNSCLYRCKNTDNVRKSQFVTRLFTANCNLVVFTALNIRVLENPVQLLYSPCTLTCTTVTHSVQ